MQLLEPRQSEGHAWAKVLENVLLTANHPKLEFSTGGEWREVIARCLASVLRDCMRFPLPTFRVLTAPYILHSYAARVLPPPAGTIEIKPTPRPDYQNASATRCTGFYAPHQS
jgi:hypothetical protein